MAYQIAFTASNYASRARRKVFLRLLLLATVAGIAYGVYDVYKTYNQPTLNMKLAEYEMVAYPIEEINRAWDEVAKEHNAMARYYRLIWAANPTNFLNAMASTNAPHVRRGAKPVGWTLTTGGECRLDYRYEFDTGDKAEQTKGLEAEFVHAITSMVEVVDRKVDVEGVRHENLLDVKDLNFTVKFSFPTNEMVFPAKESTLTYCVNEIAALRKKVHGIKVAGENAAKGTPSTAQEVMMAYLSSKFGKDNPDFPALTNAISVSGWFDRADQFIMKYKIPGDATERRNLRNHWNKIGDARFPWDRLRTLDNDVLVIRTKVLGKVSDGVKRFKGFLDKRHADCLKKLAPFVDAYERNDIFNKPYVEVDLKDRVAKPAGIVRARTTFKDEDGADPASFAKDKEKKITLTWVRWKLMVGDEAARDGERNQQTGDPPPEEPLTLERLADCARRTLELGPGYALDTVRVKFKKDGSVAGAIFEGLLPVKKTESTKEAKKDVN